MNAIRKSTFAALIAAAVFAPLAVSAADFTSHDSAAIPTPFSTGDRTPTVRAPLGAPQFVTQELIAKPSAPTAGFTYERVNGRWVHVEVSGDHDAAKPGVPRGSFTISKD